MSLLDQFVVRTLPLVPKPIVRTLSKPYIAGADLQNAVDCIKSLNDKGFRATVDVLGEFVTTFDHVDQTVKDYMDVLNAIEKNHLDSNISIKPTSFGLLLDQDRSFEVIAKLMSAVSEKKNFMRIDMEDSPCTTMTIELYDHLRATYGTQVGIVLQAYLKRTLGDIKSICDKAPSHFRLCKGIYVEPAAIAYKDYEKVRQNYLDSLAAMFDGNAFVGIATHDDYLVEQAQKIIAERNLGPDRYEFQMLLGVREPLRDKIRDAGHPLRIYVPFGKDWYGYSVRRLKENPALAGTFFKAMFIKS